MNFKIGDRVIFIPAIMDNCKLEKWWTGTIAEVDRNGYVLIKADAGRDWWDSPSRFIFEDLFNSPLFKALV